MRTENLATFIKDAEARAKASGVSAMPVDRLRNRGASRTPAKRVALAAANARALAAGAEPIPAYY